MDFFDVRETKFGSDATDGKEEIVTATLVAVGEDAGQDELAAEIWGHYGFTSRPAAPSDGGKCQAIAEDYAGKRIVTASRDLRGAECHGALNAGDVAMWAVGGASVRTNADGSIALVSLNAPGGQAGISIQADGKILIYNKWGTYELGPDGHKWGVTAGGSSMELAPDHFQCMAPQGFIRCGSVGLGITCAIPLTFAPLSGVASPAPYIFV